MKSWAACMSLPTGVLLTCHEIMTVTTPSSPAAPGLPESKELLPASGETACTYPVVTFSDLLCSPVALTVHPEQHFWDSFITSLLLPASQHSAVSQGHFRFARQPNVTHSELSLLVPTSVPPQAPGLKWEGSTTGKEGGKEETYVPNLRPLGKVQRKKKQGAGKCQKPHAWSRAGEWSTRIFGAERSLGLMDLAVEEGKISTPPPLHTLYMCYKATETAGQGRIVLKGIHHPHTSCPPPSLP